MGPAHQRGRAQKVEGWSTSAVGDGATVVTGGKRAERRGRLLFRADRHRQRRRTWTSSSRRSSARWCRWSPSTTSTRPSRWPTTPIYGLTSSIYTRDLNVAMRACNELRFGETYINRENFEAMQGFHAGGRRAASAARTASTACTSSRRRTSSTCRTRARQQRTVKTHPHHLRDTAGIVRSVLLICAFNTARMCRVSTQITGKPASARALNSHCDSGPASNPIRLKR